jgi:FkbH-like protein
MIAVRESPGLADALQAARAAIRDGDAARALALLRERAAPGDPAALQIQYARLAREIAKGLSELPTLRVAFLGNSTLKHWVDCLRFWLLLDGWRIEELLVPFGAWRQQVVDKDSDLYRFQPDVVWFFILTGDLHCDADLLRKPGCFDQVAEAATTEFAAQLAMVAKHLPALCVVNNLVAPADGVFGNLEGSNAESLSALISKFNWDLAGSLPEGSVVFDIAHLAAKFGLDRWEDARLWHHSKHPFALDAQGPVAFAGARLLAAARGRARKCLVVDLDNTLWGGVIGDDGIEGIRIGPDGGAVGEAFASFQEWLKALVDRGIALAVCSKNDEELAREPFLHKDGMILKLDDFVSFKVNWGNKADNIRAIAAELNLGLDAFVFVDDNPAERALVRAELPLVAVPEMPPDPSEYVRTLAAGMWFETLAVTAEDRSRVRSYRENMARTQAQSSATDLASYLSGLRMTAKWGDVDAGSLPRATQLVNKTNQFHLTNTRYSEAQMRALTESPQSWVGQFSLSDRFGDYGIIAVVVLRWDGGDAAIDTWVMSCRVFSRQMEDFIFGTIWNIAKQHRCLRLRGLYVPTRKNTVVAGLYGRFGGTQVTPAEGDESTWSFDLSGPSPPGSPHIADVSLP